MRKIYILALIVILSVFLMAPGSLSGDMPGKDGKEKKVTKLCGKCGLNKGSPGCCKIKKK